jgi:hypothetical protein
MSFFCSENKQNQPKLLPVTQDVMTFSKYLKSAGQANFEMLNRSEEWTSECRAAYCELNEIALAKIISFNRRHAGEVDKASVLAFGRSIACKARCSWKIGCPTSKKPCARLSSGSRSLARKAGLCQFSCILTWRSGSRVC